MSSNPGPGWGPDNPTPPRIVIGGSVPTIPQSLLDKIQQLSQMPGFVRLPGGRHYFDNVQPSTPTVPSGTGSSSVGPPPEVEGRGFYNFGPQQAGGAGAIGRSARLSEMIGALMSGGPRAALPPPSAPSPVPVGQNPAVTDFTVPPAVDGTTGAVIGGIRPPAVPPSGGGTAGMVPGGIQPRTGVVPPPGVPGGGSVGTGWPSNLPTAANELYIRNPRPRPGKEADRLSQLIDWISKNAGQQNV